MIQNKGAIAVNYLLLVVKLTVTANLFDN